MELVLYGILSAFVAFELLKWAFTGNNRSNKRK
jgi:hypothetical protein